MAKLAKNEMGANISLYTVYTTIKTGLQDYNALMTNHKIFKSHALIVTWQWRNEPNFDILQEMTF